MATGLPELRREAKRLGVKGVKGMDREELEAAISKAQNGTSSKGTRKRAVKKAVTKKTAKKKTATKKRGTSAPAKRKTAKRQASATSTRKPARKTTTARKPARQSADSGRHMIGSLDFSVEDGWNPRSGSPVERIFKVLKKRRGNVDKVFEDLRSDIGDFVPARKRNGEKRTKADREAFLRYRINRVRFDFAVATGQHEPSTNRAKYGTGGTGDGIYKRPSGRPAAKKTATKTTGKRRGRPPGSKSVLRGRPPGSKNKSTSTSKTRKRSKKR